MKDMESLELFDDDIFMQGWRKRRPCSRRGSAGCYHNLDNGLANQTTEYHTCSVHYLGVRNSHYFIKSTVIPSRLFIN